jgi:hypothetical protein
MATTPDSTTSLNTVYASPCGRVRVERDGPHDFALYLDERYTGSYECSTQAEHDGAVWLHEQAMELAAVLADEAAMRDAARTTALDTDAAFAFNILITRRTNT